MEGSGNQSGGCGSSLEEEIGRRQIPSKKVITSDNETVNQTPSKEELVLKKKKKSWVVDGSVPHIMQQTMDGVVEFLKKKNATLVLDKAWEDEFLRIHSPRILQLFCAAEYLQLDGLLDLAGRGVADMIKDMNAEEVRAIQSTVPSMVGPSFK